ncbi:MAG: hypothetical protein ITG02_04275 [Patulibacter sp.]|nr:hypothetical protein [Patulibacter sp.]
MTPTLSATSRANDEQLERAVLLHLFFESPAMLTDDEVRRALAADESFAERDAIDRAVRDLAAAGVLRRVHGVVALTRAAARTAHLLERS